MELKRDHGYTQKERLKHNGAMNKHTGKLRQKKNTTPNLMSNVFYYIFKKLHINLILKSAHHKESQIIRYFEKFSKLGVSRVLARLLTLYAQIGLVMYNVFLFSSSILHYFLHKICLEEVYYTCHLYLTTTVIEI